MGAEMQNEGQSGVGPDLGIPNESAVHVGDASSSDEAEDLLEGVETKDGTEG